MKKSMILIIFFVLLTITWCFSQNSNILTFDQSLDILQSQSNILLNKYLDFFDYSWNTNQDINLSILSLDKSEPTKLSINSQISINPFSQNYTSLIQYDLNLFDKVKTQKIISSWSFLYSNIEYVPYFKLNQFSLDMWTGNIESEFLKAMLWWIIDKRIMIDVQDKKNLIQNYVDMNYLLKDIFLLNKCNIFYKVRNTIYKTKRSYKIWLDQQKISACINNPFLDYTWIVFEWFLTPLKDNKIFLEIKKLQLPDNKDMFISWEFDDKNLKLVIHNILTKTTTSVVIDYNKNKDKISFESSDINYQIILDKINDILNIEWKLSLSTNNVKETKLKFDIKWNLVLQNTWYLDIKSPQNYLIMSQLLWDKFSLKNIFWQ